MINDKKSNTFNNNKSQILSSTILPNIPIIEKPVITLLKKKSPAKI